MKFMFELFAVFCDFRRADEKSIPSRVEHQPLLHLRPDEKHSPLKMRKQIPRSVLCPSTVASRSHKFFHAIKRSTNKAEYLDHAGQN